MSRACVRCAIGASLLSTMLLIAGPVPAALADESSTDTNTSASTSPEPAADTTGPSANEPSPRARPLTDLRTALQDTMLNVRNALEAVTSRRPQSAGALGSGTSTEDIEELFEAESALADEAPDALVTEPQIVAPEPTLPLSTGITAVVPDPPSGTSSSPPANSAAPLSVPVKTTTVKSPLLVERLPAAARTIGNTVALVLNSTQQTVATVPTLLAGLPTSTTPGTDVITALEFMLTSVGTSVGAIAALPNELGSLLIVPNPSVAGTGPAPEARPTALTGRLDLPALMLPQAPPTALGSGTFVSVPASPALPPVAPVNSERTTPITEAPLGMSGLSSSGAHESFLDRAVSTLLVPISIATLAAVALPGVGGLLVICALGVRIGYRQAKAGWAIHVAGIGRFAGSGPLGVVRSGSMITLHMPRTATARKSAQLRLVDRSVDQAA